MTACPRRTSLARIIQPRFQTFKAVATGHPAAKRTGNVPSAGLGVKRKGLRRGSRFFDNDVRKSDDVARTQVFATEGDKLGTARPGFNGLICRHGLAVYRDAYFAFVA